MNGIHDMGGLHGFGPVVIQLNEPVFHSAWEARVYAMTQVIDTTGIWNLDEHRHAIELMDAASYLTAGYYGRWLFAMERLLNLKGILSHDEVNQWVSGFSRAVPGTTSSEVPPRNWPLPDDQKTRWGALRGDVEVCPRFAVGDAVRVKNVHPEGHTRVTAYTRGHSGVVMAVNARAWVYPDTRAHHRGENLQAVYNVRFTSAELWGSEGEPNTSLHIDLSENHLEPAEAQHEI